MCGVIGIISPGRTKEELPGLKKGLSELVSRGPNDEGIWMDESVLLGHRRLAIVNPENARQPILSDCGNIIVTCNGEFYDFEDIKNKLLSDYKFKTDSDSEILIPLYLKFGIKGMMKHLRGEFAFIIYDKNKRKVYAVRDRFGIKPLVWHYDSKKVIIASKVKAIKPIGVDLNWNYDSLYQAITMQYPLITKTYFKDISQLSPACFLEIDFNNDSIQIKEKRYWDINKKTKIRNQKLNFDEAADQLREILLESITLRMRGEAKFCCHLSGGLDSSIIAGVMSKYSKEKIDCFSIVFPEIDALYDESEIARETIEYLGGVFHPVSVSQQDIFNHLSDAVYWSEGLAVNGHLSCKFLLNKEISRLGFKVALTGEGADEAFAGYSHLRQDLINGFSQSDAELKRNLYELNKAVVGTELSFGESLDCNIIKEHLGFLPSFIKAKASIGHKLYNLLRKEISQALSPTQIFSKFLLATAPEGVFKNSHPIEVSSVLWIKSSLCNYILNTLGDGCEMAWSIEGRLPFLDHYVFEFSQNIPIDFKIKDYSIEKHILREAMKEFITEKVYKRHKNAFQAPPLTKYFTLSILNQIREELFYGNINKLNLFDRERINQLITSISNMNPQEQISIEPVVMLLLTINHLTSRFHLN